MIMTWYCFKGNNTSVIIRNNKILIPNIRTNKKLNTLLSTIKNIKR